MSNSANSNQIVETVIVPDWWDTSSVETCHDNFRATLEASRPDSTEVQFFARANTVGEGFEMEEKFDADEYGGKC